MRFDVRLYKKIFFQITLSSTISLAFYLALQAILGAIMREADNDQAALWILSVFVSALFSFVLIYRTQYIDEYAKYSVVEAHGEKYLGFGYDLKLLSKTQLPIMLSVLGVNLLCWALTSIDYLLFGKRTFTVVLMLFAPMHITVTALPSWMPDIIGYILGALFVCATYLLELIFLRKRWFKKYHKA